MSKNIRLTVLVISGLLSNPLSIVLQQGMTSIVRVGFCIVSLYPTIAWSEVETTPRESRLVQLAKAYGFARSQALSLELIQQQFPDLKQKVDQASVVFESSAFGEGAKGIVVELETTLGAEEWSANKKTTETQLQEMLGGKQLTREESTEFLEEVKRRSKGAISESIRATLLSANPRFLHDPEREFAEGFRQTFRTKGHEKAKGADLALSLPASWKKREGYRPNIVQVFESGNGNGEVMCNLLVKDLGVNSEDLPLQEVREFFEPNGLKDLIPEGATIIEAKSMVLEGSPAGMVVFDQTETRLDTTFTMRMTHFITIQKNLMIAIQFAINSPPTAKASLDESQQKNIGLFRAVANSFVYNDRYN